MNREYRSKSKKSAKRGLKRSSLFLTSILYSGLAETAFAQVTVNLPPVLPAGTAPIRSPLDENSVNLGNGRLETTAVDLSIGSVKSGGLIHARHWVHTTWRDGFAISLGEVGSILTGLHMVVSYGPNSYTFTETGSVSGNVGPPFVSEQGNGATLTLAGSIYSFTAPDGTILLFDSAQVSTNFCGGFCGGPAPIASATDVIMGNGERIKLNNKKVTIIDPALGPVNYVRLQSVSNNYGYQLKYQYAGNILSVMSDADQWQRLTKITGLNTATEYCDPAADTCTFVQSWPSVTYATVGVAETSTDSLGRVTKYTHSAAAPVGAIIAVKRPSSATDNIAILYGTTFGTPSFGAVTSITKVGIGTWTYDYVSSAGGVTITRTDPLGHTRVTTTDGTQLVTKTDKDELNRVTTTALDSLAV
jgi:hypothetical protein